MDCSKSDWWNGGFAIWKIVGVMCELNNSEPRPQLPEMKACLSVEVMLTLMFLSFDLEEPLVLLGFASVYPARTVKLVPTTKLSRFASACY